MRILRKVASRVGLVLLGLLLGLVLLEGILRVVYRSDTFVQPDPSLGWFHIPNYEGWQRGWEFRVRRKINSKGLRDREYPYEKPEGVFRILVLGDSHAAGHGVDLQDAFPKVLEAQLNGNSPGKFEVINGGVGGYGTANELAFFLTEAHKYEPDIVLLSFVTGTDVRDNSPELQPEFGPKASKPVLLNHRLLEPVAASPLPAQQSTNDPSTSSGRGPGERTGAISFGDFQKFFLRNSKLYPLIESWALASPPLVRFLGTRNLFDATSYLWIYAPRYTVDQEEAWALTRALIVQLQKEVEARGAKLVVVIGTNKAQVDERLWQTLLDGFPSLEGYDVEKPDRILMAFLEERGIPYLQLLPHFREYTKNTGDYLFYHFDGHWNAEGHRLAGEAIYNYLIETGLVDISGQRRGDGGR